MEKEASSTDDTSSFTLLVSCTSGLSLSQVSVACSEAYDRIPHSEIWEQRSQKNNSFFNGKKFRYGGYVLESGDGSVCEPHLCLHLGLTDYRTFVGTNLSPMWERFLFPSEASRNWYNISSI
ncbi:hypothetical protein GLYMA_11G145018v4 [Glycine max]|nr:hypothetical protein GLYMA_11G145018v4 [Glycine max]KAH1140799.1 hypothetical protein GYH30_057323 [Glycine max]